MAATELQGKKILITGAGRGLGKRLALGLARLGAKIALVGRNKGELDIAHIEIEQAGGSALRIKANVTDPEQMALAVNRARVAFGTGIDALICGAGVPGPLNSFVDASPRQWAEAIEVNVMGVVNACRAVLPSMLEQRSGKLIALTCEADNSPKLGFSAYTTSKVAVVRFIEAIAAEMLHHNIQANCFDPGAANTSLTDDIIGAEDYLEANVVNAARETRRTGGASPELQLEHVSFLASERSNHITGKLIHVSDDWKKLVTARYGRMR